VQDHPLDNPVWSSLASLHRGLAEHVGPLVRYAPEVAPFAAIERPVMVSDETMRAVVRGETLMLGLPPELRPGWRATSLGEIVQMVCDARVDERDGPPIISLDDRADAVLELVALVYPHYFRPRTMALGRYMGIFEDGRLAAMIGERMGMDGFREISAVCTHPEFLGRGLARRLLAHLGNDIFTSDATPFLHVSPSNTRARALYEANGYRVRRTIAFWSLGQ
jgi:ribosomal protein S18 acetylase RimI-like enzyme